MCNKLLISIFMMLNVINCNSMEIDKNCCYTFSEYNNLLNIFYPDNIFYHMNSLPLPKAIDYTKESEQIQKDTYTEEKANTFIENLKKKGKNYIDNKILNEAIPTFGEEGVNKLLVKYISHNAYEIDKKISETQENIIDTECLLKCCCGLSKNSTGKQRLEYLESQKNNTLLYNNVYVAVKNDSTGTFANYFVVLIYIKPNVLAKKLIYTFTNNDNIALSNILNILHLSNINDYNARYIRTLFLKIIGNNEVINNSNFLYNVTCYISYTLLRNTSTMLDIISKELETNLLNNYRKVGLKKVESIINNINTFPNLFNSNLTIREQEWKTVLKLMVSTSKYYIARDTLINNNNKELIINVLNSNIFSDVIKRKILGNFVFVVFEEKMSENYMNKYKPQTQIDNFNDNEITEEEKNALYFIKKSPTVITNNDDKNKIYHCFLNNFLPLLTEKNFYEVLRIISSDYINDKTQNFYVYGNNLKNNINNLLIDMMFSKFINNSDKDNKDIIEERQSFVDEFLNDTLCDRNSTKKLFNTMNNDNKGESKYTKAFINGMIRLIVKNNNYALFEKHINNIKEFSCILNNNIKILFRNKINQFMSENMIIENDQNTLNLGKCFKSILDHINK